MAKEKAFALELKCWRGHRGWTQKVAAANIRVDVDVYRKWEQGSHAPSDAPNKADIRKRMQEAK
jgi:DNA-binding transcriptional regulator YiaG